MYQWEYEAVQLSGSKDQEMIPLLDVKGKLGWELVSVVVIPSAAAKKAQLLAFLKRPLETEQ